jgi:hypothetical protein
VLIFLEYESEWIKIKRGRGEAEGGWLAATMLGIQSWSDYYFCYFYKILG